MSYALYQVGAAVSQSNVTLNAGAGGAGGGGPGDPGDTGGSGPTF